MEHKVNETYVHLTEEGG